MPEEIGASAPDVTTAPSSESSATQAQTGSSPVQDGSGTPSSDASGVTTPVQGASQPSIADILKDLPAVDELKQQADQGTKYAAALANLRGVVEPVHTQFSELQTKYQAVEPYQQYLERFERPEQLQESLDIYDSLIGWTQGQNGLEPNTELGAQKLTEKFPLHADFLAADLLRGESTDPTTGQRMPRIDIALSGMAKDPTERAKVAKMFGLVEPSSISPQWQPTEDQLAVVKPELQDIFKSLPYDEREKLSVNDPDFINSQLQEKKLMKELIADKEQTQIREQQRIKDRENYIKQQADSAGEQYVTTRETEALTTFHNNVVAECDFIKPLDMANLPQGVSPEQAAQFNLQADQTNKAEAAQITLAVIGIVNPQTRPFVLPLLKQIGAIDDATVKAIEESSDKFGNNGRNYGHLEYRGKMSANGNGYQPDASVTGLRNAADSGLKLLIHTANQIKKNLIEKKGQTFQMKANGYNATLDSVAGARPSPNGTTFNPATAAQPRPEPFKSRAEMDRLYG